MHRKYRLLERECQIQAALTGHENTRQELKKMAQEYRILAVWLERRQQRLAGEMSPAEVPPEEQAAVAAGSTGEQAT